MNALDLGISVLLCLLIVRGMYRGFIRQVFSLGAIFGGVVVSGKFYQEAGKLVKPLIREPLLVNIVGWAMIFTGVAVLLILIGGILHRRVTNSELSGANRIAGTIFAAATGIILVVGCIGILAILMTGRSEVMNRSFLVPRALWALHQVAPIFPEEYRRFLETRLKTVREEMRQSRAK